MRWSRVLALSIAVGMLSSCAKAPPPPFDSVYTSVQPSSVAPGQSIPAPTADVLIRISGNVNAKQVKTLAQASSHEPSGKSLETGRQIELDQANFDAIGLVEYEVLDPFEKKNNRFRGVLMRDLLALLQASPEAQQVTITALNDYQIKIPIELLQSYPILLATHQNGAEMQSDYRGPAMLIAPYEQYPAVDALANPHNWIWQITHIHIE